MWVVAVAVVSAGPHHSPERHLRSADGTPKGGDTKVLAAVRGKQRVTKLDEGNLLSCDKNSFHMIKRCVK